MSELDNDKKFQMELEFVQCLANPAYLNCTLFLLKFSDSKDTSKNKSF